MSRKKIDISKLDLKKIGGRLAYIRIIKGLTGNEFAGIIGLTKGNISNFENHKYEPSFKTIVEITKHFNVDPAWLLTGDGVPFKKADDERPQGVCETQEAFSVENNVYDLKHLSVIRKFNNKPLAIELNENLVELEKLSPEAYKKVVTYVQGVTDGVKAIFETGGRSGGEHADSTETKVS